MSAAAAFDVALRSYLLPFNEFNLMIHNIFSTKNNCFHMYSISSIDFCESATDCYCLVQSVGVRRTAESP